MNQYLEGEKLGRLWTESKPLIVVCKKCGYRELGVSDLRKWILRSKAPCQKCGGKMKLVLTETL